MHYNAKTADYTQECHAFMAGKGLSIDTHLIVDGKIHRYSADRNKHKPDEWYVAHSSVSYRGNECLIVAFGSWSDGSKYVYKSFDNKTCFDDKEIAEFKETARLNSLKVESEIVEEHTKAAVLAKELWDTYFTNPPTKEYAGYAQLKGIKIGGHIKFGLNPSNHPSMVIPLFNAQQELRSLQYISYDGHDKSYKTFLKGAEKRGNFHIIGTITEETLHIFFVEGYATGASVFEAINKPVVVCFDAGNIEVVVESFRQKFPEKLLVIAADKDKVGLKKAFDAAAKFQCKVMVPSFPESPEHKDYTDFNDLHQACGIEYVRQQLAPNKFTSIREVTGDAQKKLAESYLSGNKEPCEDFNLNVLPLLLKDYISLLCGETNAHPLIITSSVLTMLSAYLGTKVYIREGEYFQNLYPNLWVLCIARSGQFKTTALNKGAKIAYDNQSEVFRAIKELKESSSQDVPDLDELILKKSRENIVLPTKTTAEGFLEHLSEGHYGAVYASEFGGWLQNLDKNHNNDFKAILTEFYDVPTYYRYKTKTQGDCIIQKPFMSICGVSTMPWISANIKPTDVPSGFFARFLIFTPPYQDAIPPALPSTTRNTQSSEEMLFKEYLRYALEHIDEGKGYSLSNDARQAFTAYHEAIYDESKLYGERAQEILQPYLKRWSPYLLKLATIIQVLIDVETELIGEEAVLIAYNILLPAMRSTAALLEKELGESEHQRKCRILFEWICTKIKITGKPIKRQTIMSSKKLENGSKEYDYVLQTLIDQGKIEYKEYPKKNDSEYILVEKVESN